MKSKLLILFAFSLTAVGQTVNPNQIRPATVNGYILTTVGGVTVWAAGGGGTGCTPSGTVNTFLLAGAGGTCTSALADYNVSEPNSFDFHPADNMNFVMTGGPSNNFNVTNDGDDNFTPKGAFNVSSQAGYQISNTVAGNVTFSNTAPGGFLDISTQGNRNDSIHGTYNLTANAGMNMSVNGGDLEISSADVAIYAPFWIGNTAASGHVVFDNSTILPADAFTYTLPRLNGTFGLYTGTLVAGHCAQVNPTSNGFIDSGNPCGTGGGLSWSSLTNPTGNLSLGMAARSTVFGFNSATGSGDLFLWNDSASNTGTGILGHFHTASGSTEKAWQADANGKGFYIDPATGAMTGTGFGSIAGVFSVPAGTYAGGATGVANYTSDATSGFAEVDENNTGRARICTTTNAQCGSGSGTVTSIATTSPITGGTITTTGTIACATCVTASSPGAGIAHFAGSTQAVTSSAVNLANSDVTGNLGVAHLNSGTAATSSTFWRGDGIWATAGATLADCTDTTGVSFICTVPITAPSYTSSGTTAGFVDYAAGSTSASVGPCNTSASWCVQAPTTLSSNFIETLPTPSTGVILHTLSGSTITDTIVTPYVKPTVAAISSATGGSGTGTVTCLTAACTNISGTYSVAGGTFTTGTFLTLVWPTTTTAYNCWVSQNGGIATYGMGHGVATATGMTVTAGISIIGVTVSFDYGCSSL